MSKAPSSGIRLNSANAAIAKGMILRGDRQHDIAAYFGVNGGRIGELSTGAKFASVTPAAAAQLPPKGPYIYSVLSRAIRTHLIEIDAKLQLNDLAGANSLIQAGLKKF